MNSEQQWWTDVNSSCLHPWPFLAMQSYSLYYYIIVLFLLLFPSLFTYSASLLHIQIPVHKLQFLLKFRIVMNFGLPATPVCVLSVSVLVGYDCLTVMFQCKLENFFTGNRQNRVGVAAVCTCEVTCLGLAMIVRQVSSSLVATNANCCHLM
jgi:hypothetical protein